MLQVVHFSFPYLFHYISLKLPQNSSLKYNTKATQFKYMNKISNIDVVTDVNTGCLVVFK